MAGKKNIILLLLAAISILLFAGCDEKDAQQKTIRIAYVNWAGTVAMTNLAKAVLETKMNIKANLVVDEIEPVYTSLASGKNDIFMGAWLPVTHLSYLLAHRDSLLNLGYNFSGARIGLVVPEYVDAHSIDDLNNLKIPEGNRIMGIDPGAGIMKATEKAIPAYNLNYRLISSSGPAMTASLKMAIDKKENIVVTGWEPHWKFARFELKFLNDPKSIYGDSENIHSIARAGFDKDFPQATKFFRNFFLNNDQLSSLMDRIERSEGTPLQAAIKWVTENEELVKSWIPEED